MTRIIDLALLLEHLEFLLGEARVVRARRVPARIRSKRRRYYRKHKAQIKRRQRRYRKRPRTKRMSKRRERLKKRLHIRPGSRRRIKMTTGSNRQGNITEAAKRQISKYEFEDIGLEHHEKFQGRDTAGKWDDVALGIGGTYKEAVDDAIDYLVEGGWQIPPELKAEAMKADDKMHVSAEMVAHAKFLDNEIVSMSAEFNPALKEKEDSSVDPVIDRKGGELKITHTGMNTDDMVQEVFKVLQDKGFVVSEDSKAQIEKQAHETEENDMWYHAAIYIKGTPGEEEGESVEEMTNLKEAEEGKPGKPVLHNMEVKLTLKEAAQALGYDEWAKSNDYLDADAYDDVSHSGFSSKDVKDARDPKGLDGVVDLFPSAVAIALEDAERDGYASAIGEARREAIKQAFEEIQVAGEYQSGDGEMIAIKGGAGIESCEIDASKDEVILKVKNPEHLINDILAGVGMVSPELDPYEEASEETVKKMLIQTAGDFFSIYGARKPTGELDSRFSPDVSDDFYKEQVEFHVGEMTLEEVAHAVIGAVGEGRIDSDKEAIALAAKLTKMNKKEIANEVAKLHKMSSEKYAERAKQATEESVERMRLAKRGGKAIMEMKETMKLSESLSPQATKEDLIKAFKRAGKLSETLHRNFLSILSENVKKPTAKAEKVITEDMLELDPFSALPEIIEDELVDEDFEKLINDRKKPMAEAKAVESDFSIICEDAKNMIGFLEKDSVDPVEANEILAKMVEFLDKSMEKIMVVESVSKHDVEKAIELLKNGKNLGPVYGGGLPTQLAHSLKVYQDRGEWDGSLESAIDCLKQAAYEIDEKAGEAEMEEADDKAAMAQGNKFKVIPQSGQHVFAKDAKTAQDLQKSLGKGTMVVDLQKGQVSEGDSGPDVKCFIADWAGNVCFGGKKFNTFDDAEEFLSEKLGDKYEEEREEYYITPASKGMRDSNYVGPNDPRAGKKVGEDSVGSGQSSSRVGTGSEGVPAVSEDHPDGKLCGTVVLEKGLYFVKIKNGPRQGAMHHVGHNEEENSLAADLVGKDVYFHVNEDDDAVDLEPVVKKPEDEDVMGAGSQPSTGGPQTINRIGEAEGDSEPSDDEVEKYLENWRHDEEFTDLNVMLDRGLLGMACDLMAGTGAIDPEPLIKENRPEDAAIEQRILDIAEEFNKDQEWKKTEEREFFQNLEIWVRKKDNTHAFIPQGDVDYFVGQGDLKRDDFEFQYGYDEHGKEYKDSSVLHEDQQLTEANKGRPPKKWFEKMEKDIKKKNPKYSADQVKKTIGAIWHKELSAKKRKELINKYESVSAFAKLTERHDKGFVDNFPDIAEQLKNAVEEVKVDVDTAYDTFGGRDVEEVEHESRDGFISSNDGGYEFSDFSALTALTGSGSYNKMPQRAKDAIEKMEEYGREIALENFKDQYKEEIAGIPEDKLNYHDLYDMKRSDLAEKLSEMESEANGDDTIMFQLRAFMEDDTNRDQGVDFTIQGAINWESPYHRSKSQWEEYKQVTVSFKDHQDMIQNFAKVLKAVKDCGAFILGKGQPGKSHVEDANLDQEIGSGAGAGGPVSQGRVTDPKKE